MEHETASPVPIKVSKTRNNCIYIVYSAFTLLCMNGEHPTSQWESFSYTNSFSKGHCTIAVDCLTNLSIRLHNSE